MESIIVFLPLILVMGAFLFFANRRQRKALDATIELHDSLAIGDRVHTTSGLQGTIAAVTDDTVDLEIAPGVVTRWMKLAVRDKIVDEAEDTDDTAEEASRDVESTGVELTKEKRLSPLLNPERLPTRPRQARRPNTWPRHRPLCIPRVI